MKQKQDNLIRYYSSRIKEDDTKTPLILRLFANEIKEMVADDCSKKLKKMFLEDY